MWIMATFSGRFWPLSFPENVGIWSTEKIKKERWMSDNDNYVHKPKIQETHVHHHFRSAWSPDRCITPLWDVYERLLPWSFQSARIVGTGQYFLVCVSQ